MKKLLMLVALMFVPSLVFAAGLSMFNQAYSTGTIFNQTVSNSTTAASWTLLTCTINAPNTPLDPFGNQYTPGAFQIIPADGVSDFSYAFSNSPSAWMTWRGIYGPFQNISNIPSNKNGIWVCTTPTAGTVTLQIEFK